MRAAAECHCNKGFSVSISLTHLLYNYTKVAQWRGATHKNKLDVKAAGARNPPSTEQSSRFVAQLNIPLTFQSAGKDKESWRKKIANYFGERKGKDAKFSEI